MRIVDWMCRYGTDAGTYYFYLFIYFGRLLSVDLSMDVFAKMVLLSQTVLRTVHLKLFSVRWGLRFGVISLVKPVENRTDRLI